MLQLLLLIPILGSIILLFIEENTANDQKKIKNIIITTSLINLLLSLLIPTVLLGILPNAILNTLHISVSSLLYSV